MCPSHKDVSRGMMDKLPSSDNPQVERTSAAQGPDLLASQQGQCRRRGSCSWSSCCRGQSGGPRPRPGLRPAQEKGKWDGKDFAWKGIHPPAGSPHCPVPTGHLLPGNQLNKDAKECPCGKFARAATVHNSACSNYLWFAL